MTILENINVNLLSYLPQFMQEYREIRNIMVSEEPELQTWLDADDDYIATKTKLEDTELKLTMIDSFMNELKQRSFNIRNAIEFEKFKAGGF